MSDSRRDGDEPLARVFEGWEGYQTSLVHAIESLTTAQVSWRPTEGRRSVAEVVRHIALGRITWLARMGGPGLERAMAAVPRWTVDGDGSRHADERSVPMDDAPELVRWLEISWEPVSAALRKWAVGDLWPSYRHRFRGIDYAISRQWTLWRVMAHDIHHGGQIAMMLAMQGTPAFELGMLGGHIAVPPLAPQDHAT